MWYIMRHWEKNVSEISKFSNIYCFLNVLNLNCNLKLVWPGGRKKCFVESFIIVLKCDSKKT